MDRVVIPESWFHRVTEHGVVVYVVNDHGALSENRLSGNALSNPQANVFDDIRIQIHANFKSQFPSFFIQQQQGPVFSGQQLGNLLKHLSEKPLGLQFRGQCFSNLKTGEAILPAERVFSVAKVSVLSYGIAFESIPW